MNRFSICLLVILAFCFSACSVKKNTVATRNYQAFITRYNVFFNGKEHYDRTLEDMEKNYVDDYSRLLPIHPADIKGNNDFFQPAGSYVRSIEKSQKAIQLHSIKRRPRRTPGHKNDPEYQAWMKREEYNPFIHNAWMLLAKSQFMEGEFLPSASTFFYISNHFSWLPETVTEARLWQARSYCAAGRINEANAVLGRVRERDLTSTQLKDLYDFVKADIAIARHNYSEAATALAGAIHGASGHQNHRLKYLLGQIYLREGKFEEAGNIFEKLEKTPSAPHEMRFNARIRRSEATLGNLTDPAGRRKELKSLQRLTRYESNSQYLDQIYYAVGNIYLSLKDSDAAKESYRKAIDLSQRRTTDMALALVALGNLYFENAEYDRAQPCFAEAIGLLPSNFPDLEKMKRKSDILDRLAVYSGTIRTNDSLLHLSSLPEIEIFSIIDAKINQLKKEDLERRNAEREAASMNNSANNFLTDNSTISPVISTDNSWYFYNPTLRETGKQEFRRRWGNRKPEDNWRRIDKSVYSDFENQIAASPATDEKDSPLDSLPDPYTREYYLRNIPFEESDKAELRREIADALFAMGFILKDELEDYPSTRKAWNRLLNEFPAFSNRKDIFFNLYFMAMREGNTAEAEKWRLALLGEFPMSDEAVSLKDPHYIDNLKEMNLRQEKLYDETYQKYLSNDNKAVRANVDYARRNYQLSPLMPKFIFLEALTYVTEGNVPTFKNLLQEIPDRFPESDVSPLSNTWLQGINEGRELKKGEGNVRGWLQTRLLSSDTIPTAAAIENTLQFRFEALTPHLLLITFPLDIVDANQLLFEVARYNFNTFSVRDFDIMLQKYGNLGILRISGFENLEEANHYRNLITSATDSELLPDETEIVIISQGDFNLLQQGGRSLIDYISAQNRKSDEEVHRSVLSEEEYPSPEEMYDEISDENIPPLDTE